MTGTNGSGKTTLCQAMTGLVPHFFGGAMSGRVLVEGHNTADRAVADTAANVGLVMEDYESQLVALTVFAGPVLRMTDTIADQLFSPHPYVESVLIHQEGARP